MFFSRLLSFSEACFIPEFFRNISTTLASDCLKFGSAIKDLVVGVPNDHLTVFTAVVVVEATQTVVVLAYFVVVIFSVVTLSSDEQIFLVVVAAVVVVVVVIAVVVLSSSILILKIWENPPQRSVVVACSLNFVTVLKNYNKFIFLVLFSFLKCSLKIIFTFHVQ
jgi:hypothetical protein